MNLCGLCKMPIRKQAGDESKPDKLACWIHLTGRYQCPNSRSEYDLATFNPDKFATIRIEDTPSEDYSI